MPAACPAKPNRNQCGQWEDYVVANGYQIKAGKPRQSYLEAVSFPGIQSRPPKRPGDISVSPSTHPQRSMGAVKTERFFSYSFLCALRSGHRPFCLHRVLSFTRVPGLPAPLRAARAASADSVVPPAGAPCQALRWHAAHLPPQGPLAKRGRGRETKPKPTKPWVFRPPKLQ